MFKLTAVVMLFVVSVATPVLLASKFHCYTYYDLGIYAQALARLQWHDLNPWISGRQLRIFSDHFDPILLLAWPLRGLLGPTVAGLCAEVLALLFALVPLVGLWRRGLLDSRALLWAACMLLFGIGTTTAFHFPFHPTTWAVAPCMLLMVALARGPGHGRSVCVALLLLFACKEEFPFVGCALGALLWAQRRRRLGGAVVALSMAWLFGVFVLRPWLWGAGHNYAAHTLQGLQEAPWDYVAQRLFKRKMWSRIGSLCVVFVPVAVWLRRERIAVQGGLLAMWAPTVALRFLWMGWHHHYNAVLGAAAVGALLPSLIGRRLPRWVLLSTLALLVSVNSNTLRFAAEMLTRHSTHFAPWCPGTPERLESIAAGVAFLSTHTEGRALLGQNLAPALANRPEIYMLEGPQPASMRPYDYVFVEHPPHGAPYPPWDRTRVLVDGWRAEGEVLLDNDHVFLARGHFQADR